MSSSGDAYSPYTESPRKRRRTESIVTPSREHQYNDAYRKLLNEAIADVDPYHSDFEHQIPPVQIGASIWSRQEQGVLFGALERHGQDAIPATKDDIPKSAPEARALLIRLADTAMRNKKKALMLRDVPAAIEVSQVCEEQLNKAADTLAWHQEDWEAARERERYGKLWLITPTLAAGIESAFNPGDVHRASSYSSKATSRPIRDSAPCTPCQMKKRRCDRGKPCSTCRRSKAVCIYGDGVVTMDALQASHKEHVLDAHEDKTWLVEIPEASLLHPANMLTLSRDLFMNRASDIASPWRHWSTYSSEVAKEPSMFRTALRDFHALTVSLTKRIVQASILQATSRLRSQRQRSTRGVQPFLRRRDVITALDILGLPTNSRYFWRGAARRCGVHVTQGRYATSRRTGRTRREVPWEEVEQIMDWAEPSNSTAMDLTQAPSEEIDQISITSRFKDVPGDSPIPLASLVLRDTEDDSVEPQGVSDATASDTHSGGENIHTRLSSRPRNALGRYSTAPSIMSADEEQVQITTTEDFDQEAGRQEERILIERLGLNFAQKKDEGDVEPYDRRVAADMYERLEVEVNDWRAWTGYRAPWEELEIPISTAKFAANQKVAIPSFSPCRKRLQDAEIDSLTDTNSSLGGGQNYRPRTTTELRTRDPRSYAVTQYSTGSFHNSSVDSGSAVASDHDAGVPTTSRVRPERYHEPSSSDMDWTT